MREKSRSDILAGMGLYLKQENDQTELQRRIKAELRLKSEVSDQVDVWAEDGKNAPTKVSDDSAPVSRVGQVILLIAVILIVVIGYMAVA